MLQEPWKAQQHVPIMQQSQESLYYLDQNYTRMEWSRIPLRRLLSHLKSESEWEKKCDLDLAFDWEHPFDGRYPLDVEMKSSAGDLEVVDQDLDHLDQLHCRSQLLS